MKAKDIRDLSNDELQKKVADLKVELFNLRFRAATGQLENPSSIWSKNPIPVLISYSPVPSRSNSIMISVSLVFLSHFTKRLMKSPPSRHLYHQLM